MYFKVRSYQEHATEYIKKQSDQQVWSNIDAIIAAVKPIGKQFLIISPCLLGHLEAMSNQ